MGRKSLLTSTEKKKPAAKKGATTARSVQAPSSKKASAKAPARSTRKTTSTKKAVAKRTATVKAKPSPKAKGKKAAVSSKARRKAPAKGKVKVAARAAAKPRVKATAKPRAKAAAKPKVQAKGKKAAAVKKPKVTIKDLLFRSFGEPSPKQKGVGRSLAKKVREKFPEAPPFISGLSKKETERVRALLFKAFDLTAAPASKKPKKTAAKAPAKPKAKTPAKPKAAAKAKAKPKKAAAAKKPKVTVKDLIMRKFEVPWTKDAVAVQPHAPKAPPKVPEAPPFVSGYDERETERIRALLFKSMSLVAESPPAPQPSPADATAPAPVASGKTEATDWTRKAWFWGLGILLALLLAGSFANRSKFYLVDADGTMEVWRGRFAPTGKEFVLSLDGTKPVLPVKAVYSKEEMFPVLFSHLQGKADGLLNDPRGPDFGQMKGYLRQAAFYAPTAASKRSVQLRLRSIDFMLFFHKADLAIASGTLSGLQAAKGYLNEAASYANRDYQRELIRRTRIAVDKEISALKAR